jgi:hypothetical protein
MTPHQRKLLELYQQSVEAFRLAMRTQADPNRDLADRRLWLETRLRLTTIEISVATARHNTHWLRELVRRADRLQNEIADINLKMLRT